MKMKRLLVIVFFLMFFQLVFAQKQTNHFKKQKFTNSIIGISTGLYLTYNYVDDIWWGDQKTEFTFDSGRDAVYALNVDKCGHFMGGLIFSDVIYSSMYNSGIDMLSSKWIGGFSGSVLQLAIEVKDAYSPYWGFSKADLAAGAFGSFWPVFQYYYDPLNAINFKFSYWNKSDHHQNLQAEMNKQSNNFSWQDNYINQTYWITFNVKKAINNEVFPDWLNIALGFSIDDSQYLDQYNRKQGGKNELYLSLDYNLFSLFKKKPNTRFLKWIEYFHFPAPAIRITPKFEWYPLFM